MSKFYIKNKSGDFVPIEFKSVLTNDLDGKLVIVRVGTEDNPATVDDIESTEESFRQSDIISDIDVSLILTPYQIDIDTVNKEEMDDKNLYVQITSGDNVSNLEKMAQKIYNGLKNKFKTVILPVPLTIKEYMQVKDILKRNKNRKERRARVRG